MWLPHFGPHDLVHMHGTINGCKFWDMVDDGATHKFLNYDLVKKLQLPQEASNNWYIVSLANGHDKNIWNTVVKDVPLTIQGHQISLSF